jgi:hypothetical protein
VVVFRAFTLDAAAGTLTLGEGAAIVSVAIATCVLVPAAESTHVFMSVRDILATLSDFALAAAIVRGAESAAALRGGATKVVN